MSRRRKKNTLLPKMIGIALLINAILLPILAQFGVFKSAGGKRSLTQVELVKLPPAEKKPPVPKKTPKKIAAKPHSAGRKAAAHTSVARRTPSGPPPVRVVAAGPSAGAIGGAGDAGITGTQTGPITPPVAPLTSPPPTPVIAPPAAPVPEPTPPAPKPVPAPMPIAHLPTLQAAVPLAQPHPEIPEDLRGSELNSIFEGVFTIHTDGTATVKTVSGTGNSTLDALALDAARRWKFRPATRDGEPVESYLRLKVEFDVGA